MGLSARRGINNKNKRQRFSEIERRILRRLLDDGSRVSTHTLAAELHLPQSTVQRKRRYLEKNYLSSPYVLNLSGLGFRRIDFLIETHSGSTLRVAGELLKFPEITFVGRSVGEHTVDLRAEIIVRDNAELLDILEKVKGMDGIRDVVWSEIIEVVGKKKSVPDHIIDQLSAAWGSETRVGRVASEEEERVRTVAALF